MGRAPSIQTEIRRNEIREKILEGKSTQSIVAYCNFKWGISRKTVEKDITEIYSTLRKEVERDKKSLIDIHISRYENLYRFYMDRGSEQEPNVHYNPEIAAKMLEKKEKLLQLYKPEVSVNLNQQNNTVNIIKQEEIKKMIRDKDLGELINNLQKLEQGNDDAEIVE